jgi:predicted heme/steroid binding protein
MKRPGPSFKASRRGTRAFIRGVDVDRFGRYALAIIVLGSIVVLVFVGPCTTVTQTTGVQPPVQQVKVFSTSELAKYNGRNGQPAYVAVDGYVYDLTGSRTWVNGLHSVCDEDSMAGHDLSEQMREAPKGMRAMLQRFPIVGTMAGSGVKPPVVSSPAASQSVPQKTFNAAELSKYNGQNGQPAYVAADGLVYNVSNSPFWGGGKHSMCNINSTAGRDLTSALNQSPPNMRMLLQKFPVVGRYK